MTAPSNKHRIWLTSPARARAAWEHALPIGNGKLGAMVFGNVQKERIGLSEETIWSRLLVDRHHDDALPALPKVRRLILDGKPAEAEYLAEVSMLGAPSRLEPYQELGNIVIEMADHTAQPTDYRRWLDLDTATAGVGYTLDERRYERTHWVSAPDDAMVMRFTCDQPGSISGCFALRRVAGAAPRVVDEQTIDLTGRAGEHGTRFRAVMRAFADGGSLRVSAGRLLVEDADAITLIMTCATDYWGDASFADTALTKLNAAAGKSYDKLLDDHVADHRGWFDRVSLDVETDPALRELPIDERLQRVREGGDDADLARLTFDFGRYLLIGSSRPGGLPANLQGIWVDGLKPPWNSDFHTNINLQMNYWPAEVCGLSELHKPLFDWMTRCLMTDGQQTARRHYNCAGWVCHHISDPWGFTVPGDMAGCGLWPMGGAWLCDHVWEHYRFTGDVDWLREVGYPLMRGSAEFFLDYLVEDEQGRLLCGPSDSPENRYQLPDGTVGKLTMGCTMDNQILTELFNHTIDAAKVLGVDEGLCEKLAAARDKLPPMQVGRHGQIQEWIEDYDEPEPGHRHISHLFALHPGEQIDPWRTPQWIDAARRVIERRLEHGGGHTGWSKAWMINFYARLLDADAAHQNVNQMLSKCMLPNLFDSHPPFQIDGNFGFAAAIAEMLVQSHADRVALMPAWPRPWANGSVRGLRLRGGASVEMTWANGSLVQATITALRDFESPVQMPDGSTRHVTLAAGESVTLE